MHVKTVKYERLFSMDNFENVKVGVEVELTYGEDVGEAYKRAKGFVEACAPQKGNVNNYG